MQVRRIGLPGTFFGRMFGRTIPFATAILAMPHVVSAQYGATNGEWRAYGGDKGGTRYSPLTQIDATNVKNLKLAWKWEPPDNEIVRKHSDVRPGPNEATPLMVSGVLYQSTSLNHVAAIGARTGKTIWVHNPNSPGGAHRGVAYWEKGKDRRIVFGTGDGYLIELNADTGKPISSFGMKGRVDLTKGLRRWVNRSLIHQTSPPIVVGDVVVAGGGIDDFQDRKEMPPGDIRGFDVRTGKQLWVFQTIPQPGEFGNDTWQNDSWKYTGAANAWSCISADPELGYVYLPLGTPNNDWYGAHRPGSGLFGESLVCLNARTGERVWHFQLVHHGLWDYDLPCAPNLLDVTIGGKKVKAIAQCTKQAFCFVFDRVTGKPLWPIEERPAPATTMPNDKAWPTQPFPTKPAAFDLQGAIEQNLIDFTPELKQEAMEILEKYNHGPLYTPPNTRPSIEMPGWVGGASWAGAAVDPETGTLFVPSINNPMWLKLIKPASQFATVDYMIGESGDHIDGPQGLPLFKPPWGRITAIDLNAGNNRWMAPHGAGPKDHPAIKHLNLPDQGIPRRGYCLVTKTLLITLQEGSWFNTEPPKYPALLRAFDKATGKLLAEVSVPSHATGAPITYMAEGKQYIAYPTGGGYEPASLIALCLP